MGKAGSSHHKQNAFLRLLSAAKASSAQIGVVSVAMTLVLVLILNVAMAPKTNVENAATQMTYLKQEMSGKGSILR